MRRFVLGWKKLGHQDRFRARIVNYADDFVILCRGRADEALAAMRDMMQRLKLTVNETKTHVCRLAEASFDVVGYTFGWRFSRRTGRPFLAAQPSRKKVKQASCQLNELVARLPPFISPEALVHHVNRRLRGWASYFSYGTLSPAYRAMQRHVRHRVRQWLQPFQARGRGISRFPDEYLEDTLGLLNLTKLRDNYSRAKRLSS
jgi:hypothetical protein